MDLSEQADRRRRRWRTPPAARSTSTSCPGPTPVGREEAAHAVGLAQHTANFHLDRLVEAGLLDGRVPAAHRPHRPRRGPAQQALPARPTREWAVSLPERRYDLVGDILAAAIERGPGRRRRAGRGDRGRGRARPAAAAAARRRARATGSTGSRRCSPPGYEPRVDDDTVLLANCPFDALAQRPTPRWCAGSTARSSRGSPTGSGAPASRVASSPSPAGAA